MPNTHYYHLVGDSHIQGSKTIESGTKAPVVLGPSEQLLEMLDVTVGLGTLAVNDIIEQLPLGIDIRARIIRVISNNGLIGSFVVEPVAADATSLIWPNGPAGDEGFAWDTYSLMNVNQVASTHVITRVIDGQTAEQLNDKKLKAVTTQTTWFDPSAKKAQWIDVDDYTDTPFTDEVLPGDRISFGGVTARVIGRDIDINGANTARFYIVALAGGVFAVGNLLVNDQVNRDIVSVEVTAVGAATTAGEWVPYCALPSLGRTIGGATNDYLTNSWEIPPRGNITVDGGDVSLGPDVNLVPNAVAFHERYDPGDQGTRLLANSSNDTSVYGWRAGISLQLIVVTISGTWAAGDIVTSAGASGWSATVAAHDGTDQVYVHATNDLTLVTGEALSTTSGGTGTSTGPALGWQKGSKFWNDWVAKRATAASATGALEGGAAELAAGFFSMVWEGEIAPFGWVGTNSGPLIAYCLTEQAAIRQEWVRWIADVRAELAVVGLPVALWQGHNEMQSAIGTGGGLASGIVTLYVRSLIASIPNYVAQVTVVDSNQRGHVMQWSDNAAGEGETYLRTSDYIDLGNAFWHLLLEPTLNAPVADFAILPVLVIAASQSQMQGFNRYEGAWAAANRDPDLFPTAAFQGPSGTYDTRDANVLSWNFATSELEVYDIAKNENTFWQSETTNATHGPCPPLVQRFKMRYGNGVTSSPIAIFKAALGGSCYDPDPAVVATGCWAPSLTARGTIVASITVTHVGTFARLTGAIGTFSALVNGNIVTVAGSAGQQSAGGNNSNAFTMNQIVNTQSGDGAFIEISDPAGTIFNDATETLTFSVGPPPIWPELVAQWKSFIQKCVAQGYIPHPVAIITEQGESDLATSAEYATSMAAIWAALTELVSLRGKQDIGIAKCIVQLHRETPFIDNGAPWLVVPPEIAVIRDAQAAQVALLADAVLLDPSGLPFEASDFGLVISSPPFPRQYRMENGVHHSGMGMLTKGFLIDQALGTLTTLIPPHPTGDVQLFGSVNHGATLEIGAASAEDAPAAAAVEAAVDFSVSGSVSTAASNSIIASIDAAIADGGDVASYTVNGRTTTLRSLTELIMARKYFAAEAARGSGLRYTKVSF